MRSSSRRKKNSIERLKDIRGCWKNNTKDICMAAKEYFQTLFGSTLQTNDELNLDFIENCISGEMNDRLLEEFKDDEIKKAFNQIDPRKALGIDGLSRNFYKEDWDVVGVDIIKFCLEMLMGDKKVDSLNETIIFLIPKIKSLLI